MNGAGHGCRDRRPDEHDQRAASAVGEVIARAVTNNFYRFVVPTVAGPVRLSPRPSLTDDKAGDTITALRAAAERGRLKAQTAPNGTWLSSRNWVDDHQQSTYKRS